jgi:hypothetical protein
MDRREFRKMAILAAGAAVAVLGVAVNIPGAAWAQQSIDTPIAELSFTKSFENGYPTDETVQKLYNQMDFQRAARCAAPHTTCGRRRLRR